MRTFIVADFFVGGSYIKQCKLSLRSVKYVEPHAGHETLENLQRLNEKGARAPPGRVDNEGNLDFVGLPGEIMTPTNARISSAPAEDQDNKEGATESIIGGEEGSIADVVVQANNTELVINKEATLHPINGAVAQRQWSIWSSVGNVLAGPEIAQLTNEGLSNNKKAPVTVGEILKFFGIMILCTKFEFRSRSSLWSTTLVLKYFPAPSFGARGMS